METAENTTLEFDLTPRQSEAYRILTSLKNADLTYGGAKGGGKSYLLCVWAYCWTKFLIELLGLKASEFPVPVGFLGRKRAVDFNKTTFETWKKVIPHSLYTVRAGEKEIVIDGTAKILYGGLDDQENVNKFNSAELAFIGIDQAEETEQEDIAVLMGSLRLRINGVTPPYKSLFTANPRHCWLKNRYIRTPAPGTTFIKALPSDNPHLPDNYESTLKHAFGHNPALLAAYLHGEWDVFEGMFFEEFNRNYHTYAPPSVRLGSTWPRYISVDWGYASPMAVYWHAVGPDRHVYTYREWYKTRIIDVEAVREVREITEKAGETLDYAVGDPQSFPMEIAHYSRKFGRTVSMKRSEVWSEEGVPLLMGDSKRIPGWSRMRDYLRGGKDCHWHISEDCPNLIDELTTAVHDKNRVEDISAKSIDHGLESCRLFLMSRPPLLETETYRPITHLEAAEKQAERDKELEGHRIGMQ